MRYATRVNSFLQEHNNLERALEEIGAIDSLCYVDLNYPEHFASHSVAEVKAMMERNNLKLSAINMRFRNEYLNGVFKKQ